jgi:Ser/Thr protein kinase RdoA (MazF antagonist)
LTATTTGEFLVHGMGTEPAEPDWPPLTEDEVAGVLARYGLRRQEGAAAGPREAAGHDGGERASAGITWRSPRPMSAAALVSWAGHELFVKRHSTAVRDQRQLACEHQFAAHLRDQGVVTPGVLRPRDGGTVVAGSGAVYEVHARAPGTDVYRDVMSWLPFASLGHAQAAGAALARLHGAAAGFAGRERPPGVLMNSCEVITAADPLARVGELLAQRPGLAGYVTARAWQRELSAGVLPWLRQAAPLLAALPRQWGHGDWHPSNLTWTSAGPGAEAVAVFDFGLANLTFAAHDLALALERSTVAWLDLAETAQADADLDAVDALLRGYESVRQLGRAEAEAVAAVLPAVHVEYALSEVEYFADVVGKPGLADLAYDGYLLGHARWFAGTQGAALLDHLHRWAHAR